MLLQSILYCIMSIRLVIGRSYVPRTQCKSLPSQSLERRAFWTTCYKGEMIISCPLGEITSKFQDDEEGSQLPLYCSMDAVSLVMKGGTKARLVLSRAQYQIDHRGSRRFHPTMRPSVLVLCRVFLSLQMVSIYLPIGCNMKHY